MVHGAWFAGRKKSLRSEEGGWKREESVWREMKMRA